jgi:hypothetical protein
MRLYRVVTVAVVAVAAVPSRTARADNQVAVVAGLAEAISVPAVAHEGAYSYAAVALVMPAGQLAVVPSLAVEYAPDTRHWGFVGAVLVDIPVTPAVGFDIIVSAGHDQPGARWHEATFAAGGGVGLSITTALAVISPSVCLFADVGSGDLSATPGISVARLF